MTREKALRYLIFLKENRYGTIKARVVLRAEASMSTLQKQRLVHPPYQARL